MGNPPFVGARMMSKEQKEDLLLVFGSKWKNAGNLDYVSCWYKKSADFMVGTKICSALVSTNSVCQGETVANLWKPLFEMGVHIDFAHRTFRWDSEAKIKAHVHCVIVGFSITDNNQPKRLYALDRMHIVDNINAYLIEAPDIFIENRKKPISSVSNVVFGSMPNDGGILSDYSFENKEEIVKKYPLARSMFKPFIGAKEFLHNKERYCLWLKDISPNEVKKVPPVMDAVLKMKLLRENSNREATKKLAEYPMLLGEVRQPEDTYIIIPRHSSQNRRYIPLGFMSPDVICGDSNLLMPNATLYDFGIMMSNVHNAWVRSVCGRIKSDFHYSVNIVYNNFPWPNPTEEQKQKIAQTAQAILDARTLYPKCSLADLYDDLTMPPELRKAHQNNDRVVMQAYEFNVKTMTESECVAELMKMCQAMTEGRKQK